MTTDDNLLSVNDVLNDKPRSKRSCFVSLTLSSQLKIFDSAARFFFFFSFLNIPAGDASSFPLDDYPLSCIETSLTLVKNLDCAGPDSHLH